MESVSREAILDKTHYGITIYSHILRLYYPGEIVMRITGRDCGLCRNPFNSNKETLHIFIRKEHVLGNAWDKETALHRDIEDAIPAGDAFDFAALHYRQSGNELLCTLNKVLYLHIGEKLDFYRRTRRKIYDPGEAMDTICREYPKEEEVREKPPVCSFFKAPVTNTLPYKNITLAQVYHVITGHYYRKRTLHLRTISNPREARKYKAANFDYCTFSGTFSTRGNNFLLQHSGLLAVDFDHIEDPGLLGRALLTDAYFETQLFFISPSGNGLKWIISIDTDEGAHDQYFTAVACYIKQTYGIEVDTSGKDVARACFLSYDPMAYINPRLLAITN